MFQKSSQSLLVEPKPSVSLLILLLTLHVLAALAVIASGIPLWLICMLVIAVLVSLFCTIKKHKRLSAKQIKKVIYSHEKGWKLFFEGRVLDKVELLPSTVSTRFCFFMHFKDDEGKHHNLMIPRDALSFDVYRKLRVALKISA